MKRFHLFLILFLFSIGTGKAQVDRSQAPEPGPAPDIKMGKSETFSLKNGLKVILVEDHSLPRVAYQLAFDVDPVKEGDKKGYVSMTRDMMLRGTSNRSKAEIDEEIGFIGARLVATSKGFYGRSLKKHTDKLLSVMADVVKNPTFPEKELKKVKKEKGSELEQNNASPDAIASRVGDVLRYGKDHPYGELATKSTVENIATKDCQNYYDNYLRPNVAYLVVVGDITKKEAKKKAKAHFNSWKKGEVPTHEHEKPKPPEKTGVALVDREGAVQTKINITYPVQLKTGDPDYIQARVMNGILGGRAFNSRLMQNLREDKGYTYGAYSSLSSDKNVGYFNAHAKTKTAVTDSAVTQFLKEMEGIVKEKATDKELSLVKNRMSGNFALALEDPQTVARFALLTELYDLPDDYFRNYLKSVEKVTLEDVQKVAKAYVKPDQTHILCVGDAEELQDKLGKFGEVTLYDKQGNPKAAEKKVEIPDGLTAQKVIDQYIQAIGGRKQLNKVEDIKITRKASMQGRQLEMVEMRKKPSKFQSAMKMSGMVVQKRVYDGEEGMVEAQGQKKKMDEEQLKQMKVQSKMFPELEYENMESVKTTLKGGKMIDGKPAYAVEVEMPDGSSTTKYFDKATGYKVREVSTMSSPQGEMTQISNLSNYKEVEGVSFPYRNVIQMGPRKLDAEVAELKVNSGISEDQFKVEVPNGTGEGSKSQPGGN